jgi:ketosteroid isomerase-like protein
MHSTELSSPLLAHALASLHGQRAFDASQQTLEHTLRRTAAAVRAITAGEPEPYLALWENTDDTSLFAASDPITRGHDALRAAFESVGRRFGPAGGLTSDRTAVHCSGALACTIGFERGMAQIDGRPPVLIAMRVTHVYRRTHGGWRLIHRHADTPPSSE